MGNLDGNQVYAWTAEDRAVSRLTQGYFANFVKTGDPNGAGLPQWTAVGAQGAAAGTPVMVLSIQPKLESAGDAAHHAFHLRQVPQDQ
jgi:para-nitrobenzyl esterase